MKRSGGSGWRVAAWLALAALAGAGCASSGGIPPLARYRPDVPVGQRLSWARPVAPPPAAEAPAAAVPAAATNASPAAGAGEAVRRLRPGDRVSISKLGIPQPEETRDVVDDRGCVNLSYIGRIKIEGLTTAEAEEAIEQAYIQGGYYRKITVLVVAQEDMYFVRGEVRQPGKYPLSAGVTLLRAITTAGGYTDFANPRKISVFRGDKVYRYNAEKIEKLEAEDPAIGPDDVIVVERKWFL